MKLIYIYIIVAFLFVCCKALKPVLATSADKRQNAAKQKNPVFLDNITVTPPTQKEAISVADSNNTARTPSTKTNSSTKKTTPTIKKAAPKKPISPATSSSTSIELDETDEKVIIDPFVKTAINEKAAIENSTQLQFKYGILLDVAVEKLKNTRLLQFIEEWYGVRYRFGGSTKKGVDCSAFSGTLLSTVYGLTVPRMARDQYASSLRLAKQKLQEGDLVFFNTRGGISHVGVYLSNNKFVHASVSHGIVISDMTDGYYAKKFVGGGKAKNK
jgi:cell wall-associated NlpC family hydrolase